MLVAFPADELRPLSCAGQGADRANPANWDINDVMGDYSLTLVDSLSAFPMMGDRDGFETAVRDVIRHVSFDQDSRVQVFEVTIRALGGLISGHLFASDRSRGYDLIWYDGQLLDLAHDLGRRLLPAFQTPTGIPIARINLRRGVLPGESSETCSAGAGSLLLEFAALSRLTGEPVFEHVARKAFFAIWNRRSPLNLIGNGINAVRRRSHDVPDASGLRRLDGAVGLGRRGHRLDLRVHGQRLCAVRSRRIRVSDRADSTTTPSGASGIRRIRRSCSTSAPPMASPTVPSR